HVLVRGAGRHRQPDAGDLAGGQAGDGGGVGEQEGPAFGGGRFVRGGSGLGQDRPQHPGGEQQGGPAEAWTAHANNLQSEKARWVGSGNVGEGGTGRQGNSPGG